MLDFIPFARSWREVQDRDRKTGFIGKFLKFFLPQLHARSIASTAVSGNQQFFGSGVAPLPHDLPPAPDRADGKGGRLVIDPHRHPTGILRRIVDAIGNRFALVFDHEVMHSDDLRTSFRPPRLSGILEIAHKLFLFAVHRNHRLASLLKSFRSLLDIAELAVPVRMTAAFLGFTIALQGVALFAQEVPNCYVADLVSHGLEFGGKKTQPLVDPQERRLGMSRNAGLYQMTQVLQQGGVFIDGFLSPTAGATHPSGFESFASFDFLDAAPNSIGHNSRGPRHQGNAAPAERHGLRGAPDSAATLIQCGGDYLVLNLNRFDVHTIQYRHKNNLATVIILRFLRSRAGISAANTTRTFSQIIDDFSANPSKWRSVSAHTEQATSHVARGGVSIQEIFENVETGERVVRHTVFTSSGRVIDEHLRPFYKPRVGE